MAANVGIVTILNDRITHLRSIRIRGVGNIGNNDIIVSYFLNTPPIEPIRNIVACTFFNIERETVKTYIKRCFESLNEKQLKYIRNDVIILALGVKHYKTLFYGFDFSKITFTQSIKEEYSNYNKLAEFQLLKTDGRFSHLKLNDYQICGMSGFD